MDIREVAAFFDDAAATWDDHLVRDDKKISRILELSDIKPGCRVLDVACGTGVLFPYYLHRGAAQITGESRLELVQKNAAIIKDIILWEISVIIILSIPIR